MKFESYPKNPQQLVSLILKLHKGWKHWWDYLSLGRPRHAREHLGRKPAQQKLCGRLFAFLMTLELGPSASVTPGPGSSVSAAGRLPPEARAFLETGIAGGHVDAPSLAGLMRTFHPVEARRSSQPQLHTLSLSRMVASLKELEATGAAAQLGKLLEKERRNVGASPALAELAGGGAPCLPLL